jgi:hypothetical protein
VTHDDIAWQLLADAQYASPDNKIEAYRIAALYLDEGPCDDVGLLDEMHETLAEIEKTIPEWARR